MYFKGMQIIISEFENQFLIAAMQGEWWGYVLIECYVIIVHS